MTGYRFDTKKSDLLEALKHHRGLISHACEMAGVRRQTYYDWCEKDPEFAQAAKDIHESVGDFVESKLQRNIETGDTTAIIFYCKTKLKKRGYIEKSEIEHSGNMSLGLSMDQAKEAARQILED